MRNALAARYYRPVPDSVLQLGSVHEIISALKRSVHRVSRAAGLSARPAGDRVEFTPASASACCRRRDGYVVVSIRPAPRSARACARRHDRAHRRRAARGLERDEGALADPRPRGTTVGLGLTRGGHNLDLRVRRDTIQAPVVQARLLSYAGRRWGDVRLSAFRIGAAVVLNREVRRLERQGVQGFVLDLRQNPGGCSTRRSRCRRSSSSAASSSPSSAATSRTRCSARSAAPPRGCRSSCSSIVSASSSEIVAAALRDHHRANVWGSDVGKALVQSIDPLDNGAALELTIARYYTPSGADISNVGVAPQIHAADDPRTPSDDALATALRVLARPAT